MKEVNLRKYYPYYTQDVIVEVPDEIADLLKELNRSEDAYRIRTYRHKAVYSLDLMNELQEFPADDAVMEDLIEQERINILLYKGLLTLRKTQRSRIIAYFFVGLSKAKIARLEGSDETSVRKSIQRGLSSLKKFFEKNM